MKWPSRSFLWLIFWLGLLLFFFAGFVDIAPSPGTIMRIDRKTREKSALKNIELGIKNFQVEYNAWPVPSGTPTDHDLETEVSGPLLACLLGGKQCGNVREVQCIEPPMALDGKRGLVETKEGYQLLDAWGHAYRVILDANRDGMIDNPDLKSNDAEVRAELPNPQLPFSVVVMCAGPDGIFFTRDDIVSWRSNSPEMQPAFEWWTRIDVVFALLAVTMLLYSITGLNATRGRTPL